MNFRIRAKTDPDPQLGQFKYEIQIHADSDLEPWLKEHKMRESALYNMTKTPQRYACQICDEQVPVELSILQRY